MLQNSCFIYCNVLLLVYEVSFLVEVAFIHIQTMIHYKFWFCLLACFEDFSPLLSNCKRLFNYLPHYECFWLFLIKNLNIFIVAWFASLFNMKNVLRSKFLKGKKKHSCWPVIIHQSPPLKAGQYLQLGSPNDSFIWGGSMYYFTKVLISCLHK